MKDNLKYTQTIGYAAEVTVKVFKEAVRKIYREQHFEVSHEEYIILETIFLNPGIIQIDIAQKISMQRSYVCKLLTKLEEAGYISRKNAIRGKRQIILQNYITPDGEKVYKKIAKFLIKETNKIASEKEQAENIYLTQKLLDFAEKIKEIYELKF